MTNEEIEVHAKFIDKVVEEIFSEERKLGVTKLFEELGERYFTAPASAKEEHHSAYPGGLVEHSLAVTKQLLKMRSSFDTDHIPEESFYFVGIFHDLGKIGTREGTPAYIPQTNDWRKKNLGEHYTYNSELDDGLTHAQRSVRLLSQFNIDMSDEEYLAILGHDGLYTEANRTRDMMYSKRVLVRMMHMADSFVCFVNNV